MRVSDMIACWYLYRHLILSSVLHKVSIAFSSTFFKSFQGMFFPNIPDGHGSPV
jgi:hypothetical protein